MNEIAHNLPPEPYRKFFGRRKDLLNIYKSIVSGQTYIASIDGVGGIGKTALAHYFCQEVVVNGTLFYDSETDTLKSKGFNLYMQNERKERLFDYVVWVTAKDSIFDPYANENQKIAVENKFRGIETLFDALIQVTGFTGEFDTFEKKKKFFEDIVKSESILFVLDNLENIQDAEFFTYIREGFNIFAKHNPRQLKILTTSRKRKRIIDNPIDIEGLTTTEALEMLKFLAGNNPNGVVNDILKADEGNNIRLIEKLGRIPLMIEFVVGRMSNKKTRGEIDAELRGYPSLEDERDPEKKRRILSEIIEFQFANMYEDLTEKQKLVFKIIVILQRNRYKNESFPSIDKLMIITKMGKPEIEEIINVLLDNKLIKELEFQHYSTYPMAHNLAVQIYPDMEILEEEVMTTANELQESSDTVEMYLKQVRLDIDKGDLEMADTKLLNAIDRYPDDYRPYYQLAQLDFRRGRKNSAHDNYNKASSLNPSHVGVWQDWIMMQQNIKQYAVAAKIGRDAIRQTNHDPVVVCLMMTVFAEQDQTKEWRNLFDEAKKNYLLKSRGDTGRIELIKLLRHRKSLEYGRYKAGKDQQYLQITDELIKIIDDPYIKIEILNEELEIALRIGNSKRIEKIESQIDKCKTQVFNVPLHERRKFLKKHIDSRNYSRAKMEAYNMIRWVDYPTLTEDQHGWIIEAFSQLFKMLFRDQEFEELIECYKKHETFCKYEEELERYYKKSIEGISEREKKEIINQCFSNIDKAEINLRKIIIQSFDNDEKKLIQYVENMPPLSANKSNASIVMYWNNKRRQAQANKASSISFSTLYECSTIFAHIKAMIKTKMKGVVPTSKLQDFEESLDMIEQLLKWYVLESRNLLAHSNMIIKTLKEINEAKVDLDRILRYSQGVVFEMARLNKP